MKSKQRFVETFFNTWSPNMAYVLGYFAADGSMYKNPRGGCYISFTSCDQVLIECVREILKVSNNIEIYQSKHLNRKLRYTLQIGSKVVFNKLLTLGLTPAKSLSLILPPVPDSFLSHFIRGYFDGDGNAYCKLAKRSDRKDTYAKRLQFRIRCGSKKFLEDLRRSIFRIYKTGLGSLYYYSGAFTLAYSGRDVVKLYRFLYPNNSVPNLERKRKILEEGIKMLGP